MGVVGDYFSFQNGYAFKSKDFVKNGKYAIIRIKELKDGSVKFFTDTARVNPEDGFNVNKYIVKKGDVLFALTGDPVNKPNPLSWVGRISYYNYDTPALLNQRVCKAIPKNKVSNEFLYYFFRQNEEFYNLASRATGSASQANISTKTIEQHIMEIPNEDIRKKIVFILLNIDKNIDVNNRINDNLEQQAHAFFQEIFVDNANPEWVSGTISDLGVVVGGGTPSKSKSEYYTDSGIAWITPKDLSVNKSKFIVHGENDITGLGLKNSSATIMPKGTVLFSSRAPIGYIAIAADEVSTNQGFKSVVPKAEIGTAFVYFFLKHNLPIIESMASGSTFKEISSSTMKNIPAVIPDTETLARFRDFCTPLFVQQQILEKQNQSLALLRDNLLPKLMSGEVDVSDIQS